MIHRWLVSGLRFGLLAACLGTATAAELDHGSAFLVLEENDLVVRTDRHYTQGIKLAYLHREGSMPGLLARISGFLPDVGFSNAVSRFGLQLGQNIYTPEDYSVKELLPNDRPYAGWLYIGGILHRRGFTRGTLLTLESIELQLGVIGRESLAKEAQTWVHETRGIDLPRGWRNQLESEPGLAIRYWRGAHLSSSEAAARTWGFIPHIAASLGNVETSARAGLTFRAGYNMPQTFGIQTISSLATSDAGWSPSRKGSTWSVYGFTGIEGWAVAHNTFLDGNLFHSSHSVQKYPFLFEWKSGFAAGFRYAEAGFAFVYRSREFEGQDSENGYGSVFVNVRF